MTIEEIIEVLGLCLTCLAIGYSLGRDNKDK